jgi:hypothetical protein
MDRDTLQPGSDPANKAKSYRVKGESGTFRTTQLLPQQPHGEIVFRWDSKAGRNSQLKEITDENALRGSEPPELGSAEVCTNRLGARFLGAAPGFLVSAALSDPIVR